MMEDLFVGSETARVLREGPLGKYVLGFAEALRATGYQPASVGSKLQVLAQFGRWLARRRAGVPDLDERRVGEFLRWRRRRYRPHHGVQPTLSRLLRHLRAAGELPPAVVLAPQGPRVEIEGEYTAYLRHERGLAPTTLDHYLLVVDRFLADRFRNGRVRIERLAADDVTRFVRTRAHARSPRSAKLLGTALRSFLRFLFLRERTVIDLTPSVPAVAEWRLATVPKFISGEDVQAVLRACERRSAIGRRDYAVLLLLARLGLRAGEVVHLTLDDIDWDAGELLVRGKGRRLDRLPLPSDVGQALVRYLRHGRPRCTSRRVFISTRVPREGFACSVAVSNIVRRVIVRSGLRTPTKGAHLLRHSLATELLRRGSSLAEIGELLRHRSLDSTALYAKVDLTSLREVAQPWPGGGA